MAALGNGQAGGREAESRDVYHTGMLFFKTGTFTTQKYLAHLKFESTSGPKRIDFYPLHSNAVSLGAPSASMPLTHVLTVNANASIMRGKNSFQILTTKGKFQLGAGSLEDKMKWMEKINQMCKNVPMGDRTYEFHVQIHPTAHSDRLRLQGQYVLKVTTNEIRLFTASGTLSTLFWSPLMHVQKAHCCVLPTMSNGLGVQQYGGLYGSSDSTTHSLLIISTERTSPVESGGFVFATQSAADIAAIINHRRTKILTQRSAAMPPAGAGTGHFPSPPQSQAPPNSTHSSHAQQETDRHWQLPDCSPTNFGTRPSKKKVVQIQSLPFGHTEEKERGTGSDELHPKKDFNNMSRFERTSQSLYTQQKSRGRNSFQRSSERVHARRPQDVPLKQGQQGGPRLHLDIPERSFESQSSITTPDEPRYITNRELANIRIQFQESRDHSQQKGKETSVVSPEAVVSPEERTYYNGEFLKAACAVSPLNKEKAKGCVSERERERKMSEGWRQSSKTKGLERQPKVDILSPMEEEEEEEEAEVTKVVNVRPRSNAFSELTENSNHQQRHQHAKPFPLPRKQTAPALFQGEPAEGRLALLQAQHQRRTELVLHCSDQECRLAPKGPTLADTRQKSSSDPELRERRTPTSPTTPDYLTIIPSRPAPKSAKKPIPTPRTFGLPPKPVRPQMTESSPHASSHPLYGNLLGVDRLLASQRSISEINLHSLTSEDLYENTRQVDEDLPTPYESIDDNDTPSLCNLPVPARRGIFQRQRSGSMGDIPSYPGWRVTTDEGDEREDSHENGTSYHDNFLHTEELYENGKECMDYWMYGSMECRQQPWQTSSCGDSGIGCTPNCSPFLGHKSFSMNDLNLVDREGEEEEEGKREGGGGGGWRHWGEETREDGYDSQPGTSSESEEDTAAVVSEGVTPPCRPPVPTPRPCVFQMCGRTGHVGREASPRDLTRLYENVPLLTC